MVAFRTFRVQSTYRKGRLPETPVELSHWFRGDHHTLYVGPEYLGPFVVKAQQLNAMHIECRFILPELGAFLRTAVRYFKAKSNRRGVEYFQAALDLLQGKPDSKPVRSFLDGNANALLVRTAQGHYAESTELENLYRALTFLKLVALEYHDPLVPAIMAFLKSPAKGNREMPPGTAWKRINGFYAFLSGTRKGRNLGPECLMDMPVEHITPVALNARRLELGLPLLGKVPSHPHEGSFFSIFAGALTQDALYSDRLIQDRNWSGPGVAQAFFQDADAHGNGLYALVVAAARTLTDRITPKTPMGKQIRAFNTAMAMLIHVAETTIAGSEFAGNTRGGGYPAARPQPKKIVIEGSLEFYAALGLMDATVNAYGYTMFGGFSTRRYPLLELADALGTHTYPEGVDLLHDFTTPPRDLQSLVMKAVDDLDRTAPVRYGHLGTAVSTAMVPRGNGGYDIRFLNVLSSAFLPEIQTIAAFRANQTPGLFDLHL